MKDGVAFHKFANVFRVSISSLSTLHFYYSTSILSMFLISLYYPRKQCNHKIIDSVKKEDGIGFLKGLRIWNVGEIKAGYLYSPVILQKVSGFVLRFGLRSDRCFEFVNAIVPCFASCYMCGFVCGFARRVCWAVTGSKLTLYLEIVCQSFHVLAWK